MTCSPTPPSCTPPFGFVPSPFPSPTAPCDCFCPPSGPPTANSTVNGIAYWANGQASQLFSSSATVDASGDITVLSLNFLSGLKLPPTGGTSGTFLGYNSSGVLSLVSNGTITPPLLVNANALPGPGLAGISASLLTEFTGADALTALVILDSFTSASSIAFRAANGTNVLKGALVSGEAIGSFDWYGYSGIGYTTGPRARVLAKAAENWTPTHNGTFLSFLTTPAGSQLVQEQLRLFSSGGAALGNSIITIDPGAGALAASGAGYFAGGIQNSPVGTVTPLAGAFTTLNSSGNTTFSQLSPAGVVLNSAAGLLSTSIGGNGTYLGVAGGVVSWQAGTSTAAGSSTQLQFNTGGVLAASAGLTWSGTVLTATALQGTPIGASSPSTGAFTALSASGLVSFTNQVSVTANSNTTYLGFGLSNVSSGTAAVTQAYISNASNGLSLAMTGTAYSGSFLTGAPAGTAAYVYTVFGQPLVLGTNSTAAIILDSSQGTTFAGKAVSTGQGGIGYAIGAGGSVTQITSKSTGVPLNKITGDIVMQGAALAGGAFVSFVVTNSTVSGSDVPHVCVASGGTANAYHAFCSAVAPGGGAFTITVQNITAGSLSETPLLKFMVLKGANS